MEINWLLIAIIVGAAYFSINFLLFGIAMEFQQKLVVQLVQMILKKIDRITGSLKLL